MAVCVLALLASAPVAPEPTRHILTSEHLRVLHWPEQAELGEIARDAGNEALARLKKMLGIDLDERIDVYIVRSQAEFDELTGGRNKPWTIGRALPSMMRVVVKPMGPQRLPKLVAHELAHVMLDLRMGDRADVLPRWLHEGIAKYAAEDFDEADRQVIGRAALADELLTLDQLEGAFAGKREKVDLAYAQSYTLVAYLSEITPGHGISPLLDQLAQGRDMRLALGLAFHRPVPEMEAEWLESLHTAYLRDVAPPLSEALIGALFVVAFLIAWLVIRRRSARIRERMLREEQMREALRWLPPGPYTVLPPHGTQSPDGDDEPTIE